MLHIPDGFIGGGVSAGAGAAAVAGLSLAVRRSVGDLDDRRVPLTGLVAAFVFAAQMLSFPVAAGTSGHLIGGVLAAVLVGPWTAAVCLAVVVAVQALFADGGLTALGLNLVNLSLVTTIGGYALLRLLLAVLPPTRTAFVAACGLAAGASVVLAALAFVAEYVLGGTAAVDVTTVLAGMIGVHSLIAIGEGLATAGAVSALLVARPDLVHVRPAVAAVVA